MQAMSRHSPPLSTSQAPADSRPRLERRHGALIKLLVPILLSVVSIAQFCLANFSTLTPWKGGGFGMFATLDGIPSRFIVITATDSAGEVFRVQLSTPPIDALQALSPRNLTRLRAFPSDAQKLAVARAVLNANLAISSRDIRRLPTRMAREPAYIRTLADADRPTRLLEILGPVPAPDSFGEVRRVRVDVHRLRFRSSRDELYLESIGAPAVVERSAERSAASTIPIQ